MSDEQLTIEQLETEIAEVESHIDELQNRIDAARENGEYNTLAFRKDMIAVKAARQLKHVLSQERRRLRNLTNGTFQGHFIEIAKEVLPEETFGDIKRKASMRERRGS